MLWFYTRLVYIFSVLVPNAGSFVREHIVSGGPPQGILLASYATSRDVNQEMNRLSHVLLPIIVNNEGGLLQTPMKRCALVGSSKDLTGRHRGADIDNHDTVIRINRLPVESFFDDFGARTDVIFSNRGGAEIGIPVMGKSLNKGALDCRQGGPRCSFGSIVFKKYSEHLQDWLDAPFTIGSAHKDVWHTAMSLLHHEHTPSTGFVAFVTYIALCDELKLYGFVGNATADGHKVETKHAYDLEHAIMRRISLGRSSRTTWSQSIGSGSPDAIQWFEDHVGKNVSVELSA